MAEYIEREAAIERLKRRRDSERFPKTKYAGLESAIFQIKHIPAADVVEVRHERFVWGYRNGQYGIWCTNCGAGWVDSENAEWIAREHDFCPKCGAKMDGKGEGE